MVPLTLLLLTAQQPQVHALNFNFDILPTEGPVNQQILILIRSEPITSSEAQYLYLAWDGVPIYVRAPDVANKKDGTHTHRWDKTFTPPTNKNAYGKHRISIWIETEYGLIEKEYYNYEITDGLPSTVEAWEQYLEEHPNIVKTLRGEPGAQGPIGPKGDTPTIKYNQLADNIDYAKLWRNLPETVKQELIGPQGPQGTPGTPGTPGADGKDASYMLVAGLFIVSLGLSVGFTVIYVKRREQLI